jgi:hypothetical protein
MNQHHTHNPFCGHFTPLVIAFWLQPRHWEALAAGLAPEEAAALEDEFARIQAGERDVLNRPCLCDSMGDTRLQVVRGRGGRSGPYLEAVCLRVDLERAASQLPIAWHGTRRVYVAQHRQGEHGERFARYLAHKSDRPQDAEPDPCAPGIPHRCTHQAYLRMAVTLGYVATCRWPRRQPAHMAA